MIAIQILKDLYTRPMQAFDAERLDATLKEAILWFTGTTLLLIVPSYLKGESKLPWWQETFILTGMLFILFLITWAALWVTLKVIRWNGSAVRMRTYVSGTLWAGVALTPLQFPTMFSANMHWNAGWFIVSSVFCLFYGVVLTHKLSGLPIRTSLKIIFVSTAILLTAIILLVIFGGILISLVQKK